MAVNKPIDEHLEGADIEASVMADENNALGSSPTEAQIKEFWEWCGLEFYENDNRFWARTPSGGATELRLDLNNVFKYAVPKVVSVCLETFTVEPNATRAVVYIDEDFKDVWHKDPALALFWAIYKAKKVK